MPEPKDRACLEEAEHAIREIGVVIKENCPPGWGFALLMMSYGEKGMTTYASNCKREDCIKLLREIADKMERNDPHI